MTEQTGIRPQSETSSAGCSEAGLGKEEGTIWKEVRENEINVMGEEDNVCKAVWVGTVKIPKKTNANDDVELQDFALAA